MEFFEAGRRFGVVVAVGVPLLDELAEGEVDRLVAGVGGDAEDVVEVDMEFFC